MKTLFKVSLIAIAMLISISIDAQESPITFGIKGGGNISTLSDNEDITKPKIGYQFGVTVDYMITPDMFIFSGIELVNKGAAGKRLPSSATSDATVATTSNSLYIQLPIHFAYKFDAGTDTKIALHGGPYVAYGVGGKMKAKMKDSTTPYTKETLENDFFGDNGLAKRFDYGLGLGVSIEYNKLVFDFGFDAGIPNIVNDGAEIYYNLTKKILDKDDWKLRNQSVHLTFGYKF